MEVSIGNFVSFFANDEITFRYQNFFIDKNISNDDGSGSAEYLFLPFGFSGISVNTTGDGVEAELVFPANTISKSWADDAISNNWIIHVRVMILDPDNDSTATKLSQCYGQASGAIWDEVSLKMSLNTVIDAVGADIPQRKVNKYLVGDLPTTTRVLLQ